MSVGIDGISSALGSIVEIGALRLPEQDRTALEAVGVHTFSSCEGRRVATLARETLEQTIARSQVAVSDIGAVVLRSSSYWHFDQLGSAELSAMMSDLGMNRACLFLGSLPGCHNAVSGLRQARDLVAHDGLKCVLVCTVDLARGPEFRVGDGPSVLGDGAASCAICRAPWGAFELLDLQETARHDLDRLYSGNNASMLRGFEWLKEAGLAVQGLLDRNRLSVADVEALVTNNYNLKTCRDLAKVAGIAPDRALAFEAGPGHVWSSDALLGLGRLVSREGALRDGDLLLVLATGPRYFGAVLLRRTQSLTGGKSVASSSMAH